MARSTRKRVELRERLVAPCFWPPEGAAVTSLDTAALVRRLILFEHYRIQSNGLKELEKLVAVFGLGGAITILKSGAVSLQLEIVTIGQTGQTDLEIRHHKGGLLPLGSLGLASLTFAKPEEHIDQTVESMTKGLGLSAKDVSRLRGAIYGSVVRISPKIGPKALEQTQIDLLKSTGVLEAAAARAISKKIQLAVQPSEVQIHVEGLGGNDYRFRSNMNRGWAFDEVTEHKILEQALLTVASLNKRFAEMDASNAITLFGIDDSFLLDSKVNLLLREIGAQQYQDEFLRTLDIVGLPEVPDGVAIDVDQLLKIRSSEDCQRFREWLRTVHNLSDKEIADAYHAVRDRVAEIARGWPSRSVRFLATAGLGVLPGTGPAVGLAASAIDAFLLDRIIPSPGPLAFLSSRYPSLMSTQAIAGS